MVLVILPLQMAQKDMIFSPRARTCYHRSCIAPKVLVEMYRMRAATTVSCHFEVRAHRAYGGIKALIWRAGKARDYRDPSESME